MILHLMKYEIKSTYRIFLTIVVSFILLTVLLCIGMTNQNTILLMLFSLSAFVIGCATFVAYFVTILNRYYKNLYGREGYLMLTLPVKGWQLVCSKFIIAMFWSVILGVTICFCYITSRGLDGSSKLSLYIMGVIKGFYQCDRRFYINLFFDCGFSRCCRNHC